MSLYLTTEANLNFPGPCVERVVAQLRAMFDGKTPVLARDIALALGTERPMVDDALRRAAHCRLVVEVHDKGWIPLVT
jgi:hypothetical protein